MCDPEAALTCTRLINRVTVAALALVVQLEERARVLRRVNVQRLGRIVWCHRCKSLPSPGATTENSGRQVQIRTAVNTDSEPTVDTFLRREHAH